MKRNKGATETNIIFRVRSHVGSLQDALTAFKKHNVDLSHIESRPARLGDNEYEFFVTTLAPSDAVRAVVTELGEHASSIQVSRTEREREREIYVANERDRESGAVGSKEQGE